MPSQVCPSCVWVTFPDFQRRASEMASIVTARFDQNNNRPLWKERTFISMRPVEYAGASAYSAYRSPRSRRLRIEPSASVGKRIFDIVVASTALLFFAPLLISVAVVI